MLYDYVCKNCGIEREESHSINESPEIKCLCGETMKIKITMGGGVIFKGDGYTRSSLK